MIDTNKLRAAAYDGSDFLTTNIAKAALIEFADEHDALIAERDALRKDLEDAEQESAAALKLADEAVTDEEIGQAIQRGYAKLDGIEMCSFGLANVVAEVRALLVAQRTDKERK